MTLARGNHDVGGPRPSRGSSYWSRDRLEPIGVNALPPGVEGKKDPAYVKYSRTYRSVLRRSHRTAQTVLDQSCARDPRPFFFRPDRYHGS